MFRLCGYYTHIRKTKRSAQSREKPQSADFPPRSPGRQARREAKAEYARRNPQRLHPRRTPERRRTPNPQRKPSKKGSTRTKQQRPKHPVPLRQRHRSQRNRRNLRHLSPNRLPYRQVNPLCNPTFLVFMIFSDQKRKRI